MSREQLILAAQGILQVAPETVREYANLRETLVARMNRTMLDRDDMDRLTGGNLAIMQENHDHHAQFIHSLMMHYEPEVLVGTVLWVYRTYRGVGFHLEYWPLQRNAWLEVLAGELSPAAYAQIEPLYRWLLDHHETIAAASADAASSR